MRRAGWVGALVPLVAALLVAGCGGSDNPSVTLIPDASETPATGDPATPGPTVAGTTAGNSHDETPGAPSSTPDPAVYLPCGDILAPVNKEFGLSPGCAPTDLVSLPSQYTYGGQQLLRKEAADALVVMLDAALQDGMEMFATSSYRSYGTQAATFDYWVDTIGLAEAERTSARPGHSEHQLGTTTDVVSASAGFVLDNFPGTPEAAWVAENSWRYGFIVSYPEGKEHITGYIHEPWHLRYVGVDVAREVQESGLTLIEYLLQR